ncbi:MAG: EthD family reductase [Chitinophagaceae bacterium]|nr:MAG: EthD family reductase [Chitinophagaceae bacterium]
MLKVTVLYGHPSDAATFEKYYAETHLPIAAKTKEIVKTEFTTFSSNPDGSLPAYYRMAELYFENSGLMQQAFASTEGKAMAADLANFASGGATIIFGNVN